ncbi:phosphatase PAP2 family protein [Candidatus Pacearchaeota archaeon]|nr:phosphatase PAP2 family protein [Candidatus Pacearchaeota archaeon]
MIKQIWEKNRSIILFALFILNITLFYKIIQIYFPVGNIFKLGLEDSIPFVPLFVIPYLFFLLVLFLPFLVSIKDKKQFLAVSVSFLFASIVCNIIYMLFQTTILRPEIISSTILDKLILFVYSIDSPLNLFPSGHVTFSLLSFFCMTKINKKITLILLPIVILIILSTLFIKQHHIPDILAGLLLAFVSYQFVFKKLILIKN